MLLLAVATDNAMAHRVHARDDDPDDIELNGSDLRNEKDVGVYTKSVLAEGKSISKIN